MSMEGPSLEQLLSTYTSGFDERSTTLLLFHCFKAIQCVHELGVAHGDITLKNLCMPKSQMKGRILLLDFGCLIPFNTIAGRNDVAAICMCIELVSSHHLLLAEVRRFHTQNTTSSIEDLIEMIRSSHHFNENDPFQWEA